MFMEMKLFIKLMSSDVQRFDERCEDHDDLRNGQPSTDCKSETFEKSG
jgi:hypothetical protein